MRPGPPPEPLRLRILKGNPGKRRLPTNEPQPPILPAMPEPPPFICGYASDEWWGIGPALLRLGILTECDIAAFSAYCHSYGQWRMAAESLARMQAGDPVMNAQIIKSKYGDAVANPLVSIVRKHAGDVVRYAAEFGLTSAARARLSAGGFATPSPPSKFDGLLGNGTVVPIKPRGDESA
ncbi:P27 family predicted phage terminase small subunit [Bradyrhizobium sp. S3.2.12]